MFNPFLLIYKMIMFIVHPLFIVPQAPGHIIGHEDQIMEDTSAPNRPTTTAASDLPDSNAAMQDRLNQLEQQLLQAQLNFAPSFTSYPKEPKINSPAPFKGNKSLSEEFILKCDQIFATCHRTYHDDDTRLAFVFNLLEGDAYQWLKPALLAQDKPKWISTWLSFRSELLKTYADSDAKETSRYKLKTLKQTSSASAFAPDFKRYSMYLDWSDETLRQTFFDGLKSDVQDRLLSPQRFGTFSDLVDSAIEWDNLLFNRRRSTNKSSTYVDVTHRPSTSAPRSTTSVTTSTSIKPSVAVGPWPMDIDTIQAKGPLTQAEKDRRRQNNLCLYCGQAGHQLKDCRLKPSSQKLSAVREQGNDEPQQ
jgi:hypothetical protein